MRLARFRWIAFCSALSALPLSAQFGGPYSGADVYSPAAIVGAKRLHIVSNEGKPAQHQLTYTSLGAAFTKLEFIGSKTSGPAIVYDADGLHVFVIDTTGRLSHRLRSDAGAWGSWRVVPMGNRMSGRPAAAIYGGLIYVFVLGGDDHVWYTTGTKETFGASWTRLADFPSAQSPTAMADGKRLMVVGISPTTGLGLYQQFSGGKWSAVRGLYTDPANAPRGGLVVAAGDQDDTIALASATFVPANSMMVASTFANMPSEYDGQQLDVVTVANPALTRNVYGRQVIVVRSSDDVLYYRELLNNEWTKWGKLSPPR